MGSTCPANSLQNDRWKLYVLVDRRQITRRRETQSRSEANFQCLRFGDRPNRQKMREQELRRAFPPGTVYTPCRVCLTIFRNFRAFRTKNRLQKAHKKHVTFNHEIHPTHDRNVPHERSCNTGISHGCLIGTSGADCPNPVFTPLGYTPGTFAGGIR